MKLSYKQFSKIRFKGRENKKRTKQIIYKISLLLKVTLNSVLYDSKIKNPYQWFPLLDSPRQKNGSRRNGMRSGTVI